MWKNSRFFEDFSYTDYNLWCALVKVAGIKDLKAGFLSDRATFKCGALGLNCPWQKWSFIYILVTKLCFVKVQIHMIIVQTQYSAIKVYK